MEHATPGDAERARISAGELSLGVVSRGAPASPPVIVLHGFTGSAESMEGVARAADAIDSGRAATFLDSFRDHFAGE